MKCASRVVFFSLFHSYDPGGAEMTTKYPFLNLDVLGRAWVTKASAVDLHRLLKACYWHMA